MLLTLFLYSGQGKNYPSSSSVQECDIHHRWLNSKTVKAGHPSKMLKIKFAVLHEVDNHWGSIILTLNIHYFHNKK